MVLHCSSDELWWYRIILFTDESNTTKDIMWFTIQFSQHRYSIINWSWFLKYLPIHFNNCITTYFIKHNDEMYQWLDLEDFHSVLLSYDYILLMPFHVHLFEHTQSILNYSFSTNTGVIFVLFKFSGNLETFTTKFKPICFRISNLRGDCEASTICLLININALWILWIQ